MLPCAVCVDGRSGRISVWRVSVAVAQLARLGPGVVGCGLERDPTREPLSSAFTSAASPSEHHRPAGLSSVKIKSLLLCASGCTHTYTHTHTHTHIYALDDVTAAEV